MATYLRWSALVVALAALGAGAVVAYRFAVSERAPACRSESAVYARLELLFGLGKTGGGEVSEEEWRAFLAGEVTPRFPDGLTVLSGYGQWRARSGEMGREPSRVLAIWYRPDGSSEARIEGIRQAYKVRFGQESVMRVDGSSCVSF
jgi:hypothetical protein